MFQPLSDLGTIEEPSVLTVAVFASQAAELQGDRVVYDILQLGLRRESLPSPICVTGGADGGLACYLPGFSTFLVGT